MSAAIASHSRRELLARARLCLVIEGRPPGGDVSAILQRALAGGVDMVQLRDKGASDDELLEAAVMFRRLCTEHGSLFILNDRPDLVLPSGADGVHLGQDDDALDSARRTLGEKRLIGISTHSEQQVAAAQASPADYLGVGPVFATPTKPQARPVGLDLVRHAASSSGKPFFAIGGIDAGNAGLVASAGATRVAVIRAIRDAGNPERAAAVLRAAVTGEVADGSES